MKRKLSTRSVDSIVPPEDWEETIDAGVVDTIADSLGREGIREPLVILSSGHIVHGVHRWAAAVKAGIESVECVIEAQSSTPEEHEAKVIIENLARRHLRSKEIARLAAELIRLRETQREIEAVRDSKEQSSDGSDGEFMEQSSINSEAGPGSEFKERGSKNPDTEFKEQSSKNSKSKRGRVGEGRPRSTAGQVVREVSKATGRTERGVRKAMQKHAPGALAERKTKPKPAPKSDIPPERAEAREILERHLVAADKALRNAAASCAAVMNSPLAGEGTWPPAYQIRERIADLRQDVKRYIPHTLCLYCGGLDPEKVAVCDACHRTGWLSEKAAAHAERVLAS